MIIYKNIGLDNIRKKKKIKENKFLLTFVVTSYQANHYIHKTYTTEGHDMSWCIATNKINKHAIYKLFLTYIW